MECFERYNSWTYSRKQDRVVECLRGHEFLGACMCLEFQSITTMSVLNSMFIGDLFLIEVSDGLLHPLGSHQRVKLYPARVLPVTPFFRSLHAFRVQKDHLNECKKYHVHWVLISYRGFRWVTPSRWWSSESKVVSSSGIWIFRSLHSFRVYKDHCN